ncbi:leucine-rich repeat domain-containing protein [Chryseobacterium sp.]|uniref:leucine-rich repeat domain-containing protein n=1 Tax=Chryseobacterium sp. TaxID=1871047 RepID=UPI00262FEF34|nr:leucine-rich repeat domain-containing protein [Chryseobacterium sp.]
MSDTNTIINRLENALNIKLEKEDKKSENSFYISGRSSYLSLSNIHFENFSALEPVFETLERLTLIECSITDANGLHLMKKLQTLILKKCSISIEGTFDPDIPKTETTPGNFRSIDLEDMKVPHPGFFLPVSNHLHDVTFTKCTVSNIYELNLFPTLYSLTIDDTSFIESANDIKYERESHEIFTFLTFGNMKLKDFDLFTSISNGVSTLKLYDCEIESLKSICHFPDLKRLYLYPGIKINDLSIPDSNVKPFELQECIIESGISSYDWDKDSIIPNFNTELLLSIAPYVRCLTVEGCTLINTPLIKYFSRLNELCFKKCSIDLDDYSLIAPKIQRIDFNATEIKNQEFFRYFTKLDYISFSVDRFEGRDYLDIEKLLSLKGSLKKIILLDTEAILKIDQIKYFTALEKLVIKAESVEFAQEILSMRSLKDLELKIYIEEQESKIAEPIILDLQHLKNVEKLQLYTNGDFYFKGTGHLKSLKMLVLHDDGDLENLAVLPLLKKLIIEVNTIDKLPQLEQLKVLDLYSRGEYCEINIHDKFPNLKKLALRTSEKQKIEITGLEKLKILVLSGSDFDSIISLENLSRLEELDLSNCELSIVSKLDNLISLKILNLEENQIKNIDGLENLKNLERLNLYYNQISDISILNKLPKLREVNLAGNRIKKEAAEKQLDKPETATWYARPYAPFRISID